MAKKSKRALLLLTLFSFLILLQGCSSDRCPPSSSVNLTTEELSFLPYKGGEMLVFKSNTGVLDTVNEVKKSCGILIKQIQDCDDEKRQDCGAEGKSNKENINFYLELIHGSEPLLRVNPDFNIIGATENHVLIGSKAYNNVYILFDPKTPIHQKWVRKVFYTKADGILRIEYPDSTYWELIDKH